MFGPKRDSLEPMIPSVLQFRSVSFARLSNQFRGAEGVVKVTANGPNLSERGALEQPFPALAWILRHFRVPPSSRQVLPLIPPSARSTVGSSPPNLGSRLSGLGFRPRDALPSIGNLGGRSGMTLTRSDRKRAPTWQFPDLIEAPIRRAEMYPCGIELEQFSSSWNSFHLWIDGAKHGKCISKIESSRETAVLSG